ncbi:hypothetical protein [Microcoleus anatoxicus]|uniref:Uncharacterized protein n=1 Tax=Microcoleus anatoxicus PTRS2 TaxID=2705321 RepID=A0ABU8YII1_9CYAN
MCLPWVNYLTELEIFAVFLLIFGTLAIELWVGDFSGRAGTGAPPLRNPSFDRGASFSVDGEGGHGRAVSFFVGAVPPCPPHP